MAKLNFSKAEKAFDVALQKLFIDHLSKLGTFAEEMSIDDSTGVANFQNELYKLQKEVPALYDQLHLSAEEERLLTLNLDQVTQKDWSDLKALNSRIENLKKAFSHSQLSNENEQHVTQERHRHVNKRFNVREGWLPLH
jgi:hypothetical protein